MLHFLPSNGWHALFSNAQLCPCTHCSTSPNSPSLLMTRPWSQKCCLPFPPASHNELFSHSGWTGQKWQESCEEWDGKGKKRERGRQRGGGEDGWNRGIQEERKLEGGWVQQREWCKLVGNQGRRKCEAGVWTEWRGKETWETEDKETVQLVRWLSFLSQLE